MPESIVARRRRVAALVAELYDGKRSLDEVLNAVTDFNPAEDPKLGELLRLVTGEPGNTWLFGVSGEAHRHNSVRIRELVAEFAQ
ncbi:MAG: hypothetical protein M3303_13465 [Gemmatimonadota bacterium]|jgi:hypothetical protein|nr:hypothetical protein [Gemmatimonadota bacterium]